jgi:predicted AlkP superfamily phosphohydrolase/phosphomutase
MVAWDAGEPSLVERWCEDGALPALAGLRSGGAYGRLASPARWLAGSPWPTFYTGCSPSVHGLYHALQWRADRMTLERPAPDWIPTRPFWRALGSAGVRVLAVDVPMTLSVEPFDGVEISGWASHDQLAPPASHPPGELAAARGRFGRSPLGDEVFGLQSAGALLELRDGLVAAAGATAAVAEDLLRRERWDLALVVLGATHRGGHKLWDLTGVRGSPGAREAAELGEALKRVYVACDDATRRLVEAAGPDAATLVFSVHGMGANTSRAELLPAMLEGILDGGGPPARSGAPDGPGDAGEVSAGGDGSAVAGPRSRGDGSAAAGQGRRGAGRGAAGGLLGRLRAAVPLELRNAVKSRLPRRLQDRLTAFWRLRGTRVEAARVLPLVADLQGYLRINLRGREPRGLVEPGAEEHALSRRVVEGLSRFVDADTGEPVVGEVVRSRDVFPPGPRTSDLPDLLVLWADTPAAAHRLLTSPRSGGVAWPDPGRNPDGRSGNHRPEGFLIVAGAGHRGSRATGASAVPARPAGGHGPAAGDAARDHRPGAGDPARGPGLAGDVRDLAPTACALLGIEPPWPMEGRVLPWVVAASPGGGDRDLEDG